MNHDAERMMKARRLIIAALSGAGASLLNLQASAASPDACALLDQAEVSAALGVAVGQGEHMTPTETRFCTWHEQGNDRRRNVRLSIITEQAYRLGQTPISSMVVNTPESGIGEEAYFTKSKGTVYVLSVKKGGNFFRVQARSNAEALAKANDTGNDEKDKEIDRTIARAIAKKL